MTMADDINGQFPAIEFAPRRERVARSPAGDQYAAFFSSHIGTQFHN